MGVHAPMHNSLAFQRKLIVASRGNRPRQVHLKGMALSVPFQALAAPPRRTQTLADDSLCPLLHAFSAFVFAL